MLPALAPAGQVGAREVRVGVLVRVGGVGRLVVERLARADEVERAAVRRAQVLPHPVAPGVFARAADRHGVPDGHEPEHPLIMVDRRGLIDPRCEACHVAVAEARGAIRGPAPRGPRARHGVAGLGHAPSPSPRPLPPPASSPALAVAVAGSSPRPRPSPTRATTGSPSRTPASPSPAASPPPVIHPGVYWTHNDSDDGPYLYAVDSRTGRPSPRSPSAASAPRGTSRRSPWARRPICTSATSATTWAAVGPRVDLPAPRAEGLKNQTIRATQYVVKYSDGARNAESLWCTRRRAGCTSSTRRRTAGISTRGPRQLSASGTNVFKRDRPRRPVGHRRRPLPGRQAARRTRATSEASSTTGTAGRSSGRGGSRAAAGQGESVSYTADGRS